MYTVNSNKISWNSVAGRSGYESLVGGIDGRAVYKTDAGEYSLYKYIHLS